MPKARILLADDELYVREIYLRILEEAGYEVVGVSDGQEAIDRARDDTFDLLITDLRMPGVDGLEAVRTIRSFNSDLATVVITGYGTMESAIEALKEGVSEFVIKPFRTDELLSAIDRALSKQRLERENARLTTLIPLFGLSRIFMSSVDLATIPKHVVRVAKEEMRADSVSLMLLDERGELSICAAEGLPPEVVLPTHQKADEGIAGYVLSHREPAILQGDLQDDPRFESLYGGTDISSAISLPLVHKDRALGVLNVSRIQEPSPFTEADVELLSVLASQAALAIDNARLFQETQDAYRRLAELDHLKSEFISIAAHELRAPLAVLLAYAGILETEASGEMREYLAQVVDSAMQLKSIIDEMVSLQRIDSSQAQVKLTSVDVAQVVDAILGELGPLGDRKKLDITIDLPSDLGPVRADDQVLRLILSNLLSNAIKFTPEQGAVRISARVEEQSVIIAVSDTGIGIPKEELERIFDRFYQVEDSLRREHGGIGLGLAIAREMADLIDGRVWVESEVEHGSTFYVSLPRDA